MKKIMILAAIAAAAISCSKSFELTPTQEAPIGFGTWAETMTKATVDNTFDQGATFKVWGFKTVNAANANVFNGVTVTKQTADNNSWSYEGKKYWDLSATSYTFYAVSPAADGYNLDTGNGAITTSPSIVFHGSDSDILVADKAVVQKTDGAGNFNSFGRVPLSFNHVAALLDVNVKASAGLIADQATVKVASIQIQNIDSKGTFIVDANYTSAPAAHWTTAQVAEAYVVDTFDQSEGTGTSYELNTALGDASRTFINKLIVMPQVFRTSGTQKQQVSISYKIQYAGGEETVFSPAAYDLTMFDNLDNEVNTDTKVTGWAPGKHYIYTITIDANAINFTASIEGWGDPVNAYNYLTN